ncbi:MAG: RnfABCDGE type electron transport complex subunit B, partial [Gammaproteobacteria bacterium]|nr:RnfABCDGE type electron transport complex subunit B [Gammaproteobacteria bacterium]
PVDAIVGAPKRMHTVIGSECTGCELCVAPCPVDCIRMVPADVRLADIECWLAERAPRARERYRRRRRRLDLQERERRRRRRRVPTMSQRKADIDAARTRVRARRPRPAGPDTNG